MAGKDTRYLDRELSWLAFNERVLQEAADASVPLGERLNFLAIFSSNLDEFFRVRVASLRSLLRLRKKKVERLDIDPATLLADIYRVVGAQQERFGRIFREDVLPALAARGIRLRTDADLSPAQQRTVGAWFDEHVRPLIDPVLLDDNTQPFLQNRAIHLVVELWPREGRGVSAVAPDYALVRVPSPPLPRFLSLDGDDGTRDVMFLDDVIRANLSRLFGAHEAGEAYAIKLSRDADLNLEDEFEGDRVASIRKSLKKRETGAPCRFLYDLQTPELLANVLCRIFELEPEDLIAGGRYHNLHDLSDFPRGDDDTALYSPLVPLPHPDLETATSLIDAIEERDRLLHFPYHRFDYVIELLEEAAANPAVDAISITLYRVARDSAVAEALIRAARAGKRVLAVVELKARFDEESNLDWSERLEHAGVRIIHGVRGLKVHAKLALITRRDGRAAIGYFGTGNFNENTARVYTDYALLTADPRLTADAARVFAFLAGENDSPAFEHLLVAPFTLRDGLRDLIAAEAAAAKDGGTGRILLKMNSLEDRRIISRLYRASQAGVSIDMIVRGICCLEPGVTGVSDTIRVRSIVDRFLEHGRVFIFENRGEPLFFLASADWMYRNLSRRVEVAFPIFDPDVRADVESFLGLQLADSTKARIIDRSQVNAYARSNGGPAVRAQVETYRLLASRAAAPQPAPVPRSVNDDSPT
jgi:polyphosphate kinase